MKKILLILALIMLLPFNVNAEESMLDENAQIWNDFVKAYKESDLGSLYGDDEIFESDSKLYISLSEFTSYHAFSFSYENGVITYNPSSNTRYIYDNSSSAMSGIDHDSLHDESVFVENAIKVLCDLKDCDENSVFELIYDDVNLSLSANGIEYESAHWGSIYYYHTLELDIVNGIKLSFTIPPVTTYPDEGSNNESGNTGNNDEADLDGPSLEYTPEIDCDPEETPEPTDDPKPTPTPSTPKEETVKNPETGIFNNYGVVIGSIVVLGVVGYFVIRKRSKFPQV